MRKSFSSRDEAIAQLKKWRDANSTIKVLFTGDSLHLAVTGRVTVFEGEDKVVITDPAAAVVGTFPILGERFDRCEPLVDAPEELRFRVDFFLGLEFKLPCGTVTLYEVAE